MLIAVNPSLEIAYSPENLRLGEAIDCYLRPGRIILGTANQETERRCLELFSEITDDVLSMSLERWRDGEAWINLLAMSIVFTNNLLILCEAVGENS